MDLKISNAKEVPLTDNDIRVLAEIEEHPDVQKWASHAYGGSIEKMYAWFKESLSKLPDSGNEFLVARVNGRVAGFAGIHRFGSNMSHVGEVGIMVHPKYQNKEIGTALSETCIRIARKRNFERLEADTLAQNKAMMRIAEKAGFLVEGIRRRRIKRNENYFDEALLGINLK